jgi:cystathionine beta-synthase
MDQQNDNRLAGTSIKPSMIEAIGGTPIIAMPQIMKAEGLSCLLTVKNETTNPGGSAKDRPALQMILEAEASGELRPGGVIVEPTSGNTGVGLAIVAAQRGYKCVFVTTDKVAPEKIALLKAYGAEVVICPVAVAPEDERSYYKVAERLTVERKAYRPNQYANPNNPKAHELTTGPEIWEQTGGKITHFVAGAGTSGTITGVARYLKKMNPNISIVVADPDRSVFSGGSGRPYLVEGVGEDFYPAAWEPKLYDRVISVSDMEAFRTARMVAKVEGLLIGGSGGLAMAAGIAVAREASPDDLVVVLNPDSGRGYLSRVYNDEWMAKNGFIHMPGVSVGDIVKQNPEIIYVNQETTIRETINLMREHGISQVPVCQGEPPFAPAEILGSVHEASLLMSGKLGDLSWLEQPVAEVMRPALGTVGIGESIEVAAGRLEGANAVVVLEGGRSKCVLSRSDLLAWYEKQL